MSTENTTTSSIAKDFDRIFDKLNKTSASILYCPTDRHQLNAALLHFAIIDMANTCIFLIKSKNIASVGILLRSMIESLSLLAMIIKEGSTTDILDVLNIEQNNNILKSLIKCSKSDDDIRNAMRMQQEANLKFEQLSVAEENQKRIVKRIKKYLGDFYEYLYKIYCLDTHCNFTFLFNNYIIVDENDNYTITSDKQHSSLHINILYDVIANCSIASIKLLDGVLPIIKKDNLKKLKQMHSRLIKKLRSTLQE